MIHAPSDFYRLFYSPFIDAGLRDPARYSTSPLVTIGIRPPRSLQVKSGQNHHLRISRPAPCKSWLSGYVSAAILVIFSAVLSSLPHGRRRSAVTIRVAGQVGTCNEGTGSDKKPKCARYISRMNSYIVEGVRLWRLGGVATAGCIGTEIHRRQTIAPAERGHRRVDLT